MARGRMLDQAFNRSRKLQAVPRDARLAYAHILTCLDRAGRACAEPHVLMVTVFRRTDFTMDEVITAVAQLEAVGLIRLYSDNENAAVLEYVDFLKFNKPNKREAQSEYGDPDECPATRDEALILACVEARSDPALAPHVQRTDDARATHVQGACKRNGTEGSVPEPTPPATQRRTRPEGRARPAAIDNYLNRRKPKNEKDEEVEHAPG